MWEVTSRMNQIESVLPTVCRMFACHIFKELEVKRTVIPPCTDWFVQQVCIWNNLTGARDINAPILPHNYELMSFMFLWFLCFHRQLYLDPFIPIENRTGTPTCAPVDHSCYRCVWVGVVLDGKNQKQIRSHRGARLHITQFGRTAVASGRRYVFSRQISDTSAALYTSLTND